MILLVHMIFGAAIGSAVNSVPLAIVLAFLSHYFLDLFPHIEYDIKIRGKKQLHEKIFNILKIALDFCLGILLISLFSDPSASSGQHIIFLYAFFAILPDGFTVLNNHFPNKILGTHNKFHIETVHFLKNKKISGVPISGLWRILSQIAVVIISIILLVRA